MLYYLSLFADQVSYLRVFQYITVRIVAGAGTAFLLSLVCGPWLIRRLQGLCAGERYCRDLPALDGLHHPSKKTTPSMGGLLILGSVTVSVWLWAIPSCLPVWIVLCTFWVMGAIGFADDYLKIARSAGGLTARRKALYQALWVIGLAGLLLLLPETRERARQVMVPFLKTPLIADLGLSGLGVWVLFVILGATNAVNLTDGLDGLAIGCAAAVALAYMVMAYAAGHAQFAAYLQVPYVPAGGELAVFCGCLLGACLGFLWFNCHPAMIFMGDTGSLALGGAIGCLALLIKQEVALVIVGGVFVMEALSVILQVGYFKCTRRRIFACSPIHHHFEMKPVRPWSETQVTIRFWILSIICALLGVLLLKIR